MVYDDEEKEAPKVGNALAERGYENLFMLAGGIESLVITRLLLPLSALGISISIDESTSNFI